MNTLKKPIVLLIAVLMICTLVSCGDSGEPAVTDVSADGTPTPAVTVAATPAVTPSPAPTPIPTPEATLEPVEGPSDMVELSEGGFKQLAKDSDIVVMGKFVKNNGIINMWADSGKIDINKPIPSSFPRDGKSIYVGEYQFDFVIEKVYKGKNVKAEDSILLHLPYEFQMKGKELGTEELFVMPELDQTYVMFLSKDADYELYYPDVNPRMFKLDGKTLYIVTGVEGQAEYWEKGAGLKGIPLSQFEKAVK